MLSFEEFNQGRRKANEKYIRISLDIDIKEIAEAFRADEEFVRKCFSNGHYSRGILAAALCEKLNELAAEDLSHEVFGDYDYDVNYEKLGEKISLEKKNKKNGEVLEECSFYDLNLDKGHYYRKRFDGEDIFAEVLTDDGEDIFAEVLTDFSVIEVRFYVPCWFVT